MHQTDLAFGDNHSSETDIRTVDFGRADGDPDRVMCADALSIVAALPKHSVDAIYIDPPFGTGVRQRGRRHAYLDRADDPHSYVEWLEPILEQSRRVLVSRGSMFVHLDYRTVHYVKIALDRVFGREQFVNEIIWCYSVGGKSRRGFGRKHDTILWYARSPEWAFYRDAIHVPRRSGSHMRVVDGVQEKTDRKTGRVYRYPVAEGKIPEDWWIDIETLNHSAAERTGYPSQKPERLIERILHATTRPGDLVGDWFAGSGTTAAVAQRLGRHFVIGDRDPHAIEVIAKRLSEQGAEIAQIRAPPPAIRFSGYRI